MEGPKLPSAKAISKSSFYTFNIKIYTRGREENEYQEGRKDTCFTGVILN